MTRVHWTHWSTSPQLQTYGGFKQHPASGTDRTVLPTMREICTTPSQSEPRKTARPTPQAQHKQTSTNSHRANQAPKMALASKLCLHPRGHEHKQRSQTVHDLDGSPVVVQTWASGNLRPESADSQPHGAPPEPTRGLNTSEPKAPPQIEHEGRRAKGGRGQPAGATPPKPQEPHTGASACMHL